MPNRRIKSEKQKLIDSILSKQSKDSITSRSESTIQETIKSKALGGSIPIVPIIEEPINDNQEPIDNDIIDVDFGMWFISIKEEPLVKSLKKIPPNQRNSRQERKEFLNTRKTQIANKIQSIEQKILKIPNVHIDKSFYKGIVGIALPGNTPTNVIEKIKKMKDKNIISIRYEAPPQLFNDNQQLLTKTNVIHNNPEFFIDENGTTLDGTGVKVAIIDSGIDPFHPDFGGNLTTLQPSPRIKKTWNYLDYNNPNQFLYTADADITDKCGHGTHVASTLAGDGTMSDGLMKGVAPNADLYIFKIFYRYQANTCASYSYASIWALEDAFDLDGDDSFETPADVINCSWGGPGHPDARTSAVTLQNLLEGINFNSYDSDGNYIPGMANETIAVVSAGNSGPGGNDSISHPDSPSGFIKSIGCPACAESAIAVGSVNGNSDSYQIDGYSSRGPSWETLGTDEFDPPYEPDIMFNKPEINAPGSFICAATSRVFEYVAATSFSGATIELDTEFPANNLIHDGNPCYVVGDEHSGWYHALSGTSMSSPHMAGVITLLKQLKPNITRQEILIYLNENYNAEQIETEGIPGSDIFTEQSVTNQGGEETTIDTRAIIEYFGGFEIPPTMGCTNIYADNFQLDAFYFYDDGSCELGGCSAEGAYNYNFNATYDDGSCVYPPPPERGVLYHDSYELGFQSNDNVSIGVSVLDYPELLVLEKELYLHEIDYDDVRQMLDPDYLIYQEGETPVFSLKHYYGPDAKYQNKSIYFTFSSFT